MATSASDLYVRMRKGLVPPEKAIAFLDTTALTETLVRVCRARPLVLMFDTGAEVLRVVSHLGQVRVDALDRAAAEDAYRKYCASVDGLALEGASFDLQGDLDRKLLRCVRCVDQTLLAGVVVDASLLIPLQHIYDGGVGELPPEAAARFECVEKGDNRRCAIAVIDVLNRLRTDIQQFPAGDNVRGEAVYIHCNASRGRTVVDAVTYTKEQLGWADPPGELPKSLYLTHRVIAQYGGYADLLAAYADRGEFHRERLLNGEDTRFAFFRDKVEPLAAAWKIKDVGTALASLRKGGFQLTAMAQKKAVVDALDEFTRLRETGSIRSVLNHLQANGLLVLPDDLKDRMAGKSPSVPAEDVEAAERELRASTFYATLFKLPYKQVVSFAAFFAEHTPFSTKHGVKGAEFDTVYVVLDDQGAAWTKYSFDKYLTSEDAKSNPARFARTRNLFYVCCSRAKKRLAVIDLGKPSSPKRANVARLFGEDKCFYL